VSDGSRELDTLLDVITAGSGFAVDLQQKGACSVSTFAPRRRPDGLWAVREAQRVLRRGGRLAIAIWGPLTTHDEWPILRAARRELGLTTQFVPPVGDVIKRLTRAGFTLDGTARRVTRR
jgi:hypothetical protein